MINVSKTKLDVKHFQEMYQKIEGIEYLSHRKGNTGIGKTLETIMEIAENNNEMPDFKSIEVKGHRQLSECYITLFTKAPTYPKRANTLLREQYGSPDKNYPNLKVLHTSIFHNKWNTHKAGYQFKLNCNDELGRLELLVRNKEGVISSNVYWAYNVLQKKIIKKLQVLAFVEAICRVDKEDEYFTFKNYTMFYNLDFKRFIDFIKEGRIMFDIRIGAYKTGKNLGKTHDHGSGFRIKPSDLNKLYGALAS